MIFWIPMYLLYESELKMCVGIFSILLFLEGFCLGREKESR